MNLLPKKYHNLVHEADTLTLISKLSSEEFYSRYQKKEDCRKQVCWHIPTPSLIKALKTYSPIVSVCSGHAYTEAVANDHGADIIATDISPRIEKNWWCNGKKNYMHVKRFKSNTAVKKYADRNVFMAWPPYDTNASLETIKAMKKDKFLLYIGEPDGGCTGNQDFFEFLNNGFKEIEHDFYIYNWDGVHDRLYIYQKLT